MLRDGSEHGGAGYSCPARRPVTQVVMVSARRFGSRPAVRERLPLSAVAGLLVCPAGALGGLPGREFVGAQPSRTATVPRLRRGGGDGSSVLASVRPHLLDDVVLAAQLRGGVAVAAGGDVVRDGEDLVLGPERDR